VVAKQGVVREVTRMFNAVNVAVWCPEAKPRQ